MPRVRTEIVAVDQDTPWEKRPTILHLTGQILRLQSVTAATVVESVIAIGEAAAEIREELPHGQWRRWCADAVPFSRQTIANYMALAQWAEQRPKEVQRLAHLGPSKLYLLLPLPPALRRSLTGKKPIAIPGGGEKTVALMSVAELAKVTAQEVKALPEHRPMPAGRLLGRMRRSIAGLDASTEALLERPDEVDPDDARQLHEALVSLADRLRLNFALD